MNEKNDEDRSPRLCNAPSSKAPGASCTESTFLAPRPVFFQGLPTGRKYVKYKYEKKTRKKRSHGSCEIKNATGARWVVNTKWD